MVKHAFQGIWLYNLEILRFFRIVIDNFCLGFQDHSDFEFRVIPLHLLWGKFLSQANLGKL
jgi:hypothetical protein